MARVSSHTYFPPADIDTVTLTALLGGVREIPIAQQKRLALPGLGPDKAVEKGPILYCAGDKRLLTRKCVAIVGSREVSPEGAARARRLARELVAEGVVVVSGLAEGVDTECHRSAISNGGQTIAVIGTPLDTVYPASNRQLQEEIYREHLLISPFKFGSRVYRSNFPQRNKVMAALTDATVIIEASERSGTLHQAAECGPSRLNRWLFLSRSLAENQDLSWPAKFLESGGKVRVLKQTSDIIEVI